MTSAIGIADQAAVKVANPVKSVRDFWSRSTRLPTTVTLTFAAPYMQSAGS